MKFIAIRNVAGFVLAAIMIVSLQYALWGGKHNVFDLYRLSQQINEIQEENNELRARNDRLHVDVIDIKSRSGAIESQARYDLGLIKQGESFYQIVRSEPN